MNAVYYRISLQNKHSSPPFDMAIMKTIFTIGAASFMIFYFFLKFFLLYLYYICINIFILLKRTKGAQQQPFTVKKC